MKNRIISILLLLSCSSMMVPWNIATPFQSLHSSMNGLIYGDPDAKIGTCYDACKHDDFGGHSLKASAKQLTKMIESMIYGGLVGKAIHTVSHGTGRVPYVGWLATMLATGYIYDLLSEIHKSQVPVAHDAQKNLGDHMISIDVCTKNGHMYFDTSKLEFSRSLFKLATVAVAFAALLDSPRQVEDNIQRPPYPYAAPRFKPFQGEGQVLGGS